MCLKNLQYVFLGFLFRYTASSYADVEVRKNIITYYVDFRVHTANLPELISTIVLIVILRHFTLINELFLYELVMSAHGNGTMRKDNSNDVAWLQINQVLMQASDIKF